MQSIVAVLMVCTLALAPALASARGGGHSSAGHSYTEHSYSSPHTSRAAIGVTRDAHGHIARSVHAKESFRRTHACPATRKTYGPCHGYVIDHVQALKHGGADDPSNMQWQTAQEAKQKDRWE